MPSPKKKRQRIDNDNGVSATSIIQKQISRKDVLTETLLDQLDTLESEKCGQGTISIPTSDASISLLRLKSFQRNILETVRLNQTILAQQSEKRDKQDSQLENLRYQHALNEESQRQSNGEIGTTEILRLVRRTATTAINLEMNLDDEDEDDKSNIESNNKNSNEGYSDSAGMLQNYLGVDWKDPSQRSTIVAKLNEEVAARKNLEEQLRRVQQDRTSKFELLATKQKLLKDLPMKLAEMEKASLSLQTFCQRSSLSSSSVKMDVTPKLGTKRRNRLDLAKTLPKALYTVYYQLQSCLDVMATAAATTIKTTMDVIAAEISSESMPVVDVLTCETISSNTSSSSSAAKSVVLKIPIPTVSDGGVLNFHPKKSASITFEYDARIDMVLATSGSDYDMGQFVIDELFPGDKGEWISQTNSSDGGSNEFEIKDTQNNNSNKNSSRAYQWCNYLGGLHVAPREQTGAKMHCSARVIVKALVRRVRATATLSWLLHSFSCKPRSFPMHSAMKSLLFDDDRNKEVKESLSSIRLSSWAILEGNQVASKSPPLTSSTKKNHHIRIYEAVLKGNASLSSLPKTLTARVYIDVARYPSIIPQWKFLSSRLKPREGEKSLENLKSEQLPLYNESLARLGKHVNCDVDQLVLSSDQTTYDWILAQQLAEIVRCWREMLVTNA